MLTAAMRGGSKGRNGSSSFSSSSPEEREVLIQSTNDEESDNCNIKASLMRNKKKSKSVFFREGKHTGRCTMGFVLFSVVLSVLFVSSSYDKNNSSSGGTHLEHESRLSLSNKNNKNGNNNNKKKKTSDDNDDGERGFNPLVIVQRDNEKDYQDLKRIQKVFPKANSIFGVNAGQWPAHLEDAEYGLAPLRIFNRENFKSKTWKVDDKRRNPENLKGIQWIASIDERDPKTGKLGEGRMPIAHHIGCMYAHFNAWRAVDDMAYDKGNDKVFPAWIMEADAYVDENQMKPRMTRLLQHAPKDYDFLMMKRELFLGICGPDRPGNCKRSENFIRLGEPGPNQKPVPDGYERRMYFYYWPLEGPGAGLSSYAIGPDFTYKAFNFISRKGADMIDGFLFGKLCRDDYVSEDAASPGNFLLPEIGSALVKPRTKEANTKDNKLKVLNCYLLGDVEVEKIDKDDKDQASLGKDNVEEVDKNKKEEDPVTLFKAKVHQETSSENVDRNEQKDIDVTVEASKPTESSSQIKIKAGDASVTQTISNNNDGTFSVEVSKKNVDGQEEGETKTEKVTIDTTQMPGPFKEMFSSVMDTMANGGPFDLLQQQQQQQQHQQQQPQQDIK
jgi:hypothetical protein